MIRQSFFAAIRSMPGRALLVGTALALSGCQWTPGDGAATGDAPAAVARSAQAGPPPTRMGVARGAVIVAGPRGYCIDRAASTDRGGASALVVMSGCRGLGGGLFGPRAAHPVVFTAAVSAGGRALPFEAAAADLATYFSSATGRGALSRAGRADTVRVLESMARDGAFFLYLSDAAPFDWGAVQPDYWRALLMVGGRTVTVSVLAPPAAPLSRDDGLALLDNFLAAMRQATQEAGLKPAG